MSQRSTLPVLIFTYIRLDHLKKTITALQRNILAEQTDLFVASDFQRADHQANQVIAVRNYLNSINGFKTVTIFEREKNLGAVENCFSALRTIFIEHDRIILMEEDIVTAPGFLTFINEAFERFGAHEKVFSITGYCPPIRIPSRYGYDAFFLGRMNAWGCAISRDRFDSVCELTKKEFDDFAANEELSQKFMQRGGQDLMLMLKRVAYGSLEAWDVRCMYTQFLNDQFTIFPTQSLVSNIGFDGTGINCGKTDRFEVTLSDRTSFRFPDELIIDQKIVEANLRFRSAPDPAKSFMQKTRERVRKYLAATPKIF